MNTNRILSFLEGVILTSLGGLILCLIFAGGVQAQEDAWLVKQKNASPNGQWVLHEDGSTKLIPPPKPEEKILTADSGFPPGFDKGEKKIRKKERGDKKDKKGGRPGYGHLLPGAVPTQRVSAPSTGPGRPGYGHLLDGDKGKHKGLKRGRRVKRPESKPEHGRKVGSVHQVPAVKVR